VVIRNFQGPFVLRHIFLLKTSNMIPSISKRVASGAAAATVCLSLVACGGGGGGGDFVGEIKVGILHSLSGTMAISVTSL
jgi:urea transport system substrate-binding protein